MAKYRSTFTVSVAATDRKLLDSQELTDALGLSAETTGLDNLVIQISDMIARFCRVPEDGVKAPTLLAETIIETFRRDTAIEIGAFPFPASQPDFVGLPLSRWPIQSITSVVEDGVTLVSGTNFEIDKAKGYLNRIAGDAETLWTANKIVVTYVGGRVMTQEYALKRAAIRVLREQYYADRRDSSIRAETVEGIGSTQYDTSGPSSPSGAIMSMAAQNMLAPYRYPLQ